MTALWFAAVVPMMHLRIKLRPYQQVAARVAPTQAAPANQRNPANDAVIARGVMALRRARVYAPIKGNCLSQSLALQRWLQARGVPAELVFGVRRSASDRAAIDAHAWVEVGGIALNDWTTDQPYTALRA